MTGFAVFENGTPRWKIWHRRMGLRWWIGATFIWLFHAG